MTVLQRIRFRKVKIMLDYEVLINHKAAHQDAVRKIRNAQFVEDLRENEKAQPRRLRFHLHVHLPRFSGFRLALRRQPNCTQAQTPLNAH
jgi:hypothetical protein